MPQSIDTLGTLLNVLFQQGNICPERLTSPWSDNEKGVTLGLGKSDHVLTSCTQNKFKEDHGIAKITACSLSFCTFHNSKHQQTR
jgi:hypothetical protein